MTPVPSVVRANRHSQVCEDTVHLSPIQTRTRQNREREAARSGRDPAQCALASMWFVDGVALCNSHAGQRVLRALEKRTRG